MTLTKSTRIHSIPHFARVLDNTRQSRKALWLLASNRAFKSLHIAQRDGGLLIRLQVTFA